MVQKHRRELIAKLDEVLKQNVNNLSEDDLKTLQEVSEMLKKAESKTQILEALKPLANLFQVLKMLIEIGSSG
jgi:hypothetical protein